MNNQQRIIITRIVVGYLLIFLLLRFLEHATPSGWLGPPLFNPQMDIAYWLYTLLRLPSLMVYNRAGALVFDTLLFATGILSIFFPLQRKLIIPFSILIIIYALSFNGFAMHHGHPLAGMMIVLLPFWASGNNTFYLLWQGIRYYICYLYTISFVWKTFVGNSFFSWGQGSETFKANLIEYLYHNPDTFLAGIYRYFLLQSWVLNMGYVMIVLLEGLMVIGFFTKKWDKTLFWFPWIIHLATYLFSDVLFFELLVLDFALLGPAQLDRIGLLFKKEPLLL